MRYSPEAADLILSAGTQARNLGHSFVGSQHILLALAEKSDASEARNTAGPARSCTALALTRRFWRN